MLRPLYTALIYLLAPVIFIRTAWQVRRDPEERRRLPERLGYFSPKMPLPEPLIWVHAVSVGEVQAAAALIRVLQRHYSGHALLVTTATTTGAQRVQSLFGDSVRHAYLPYDLPGAVRRFFQQVRPALAIIMETEIWPNLYRECAVRGVPIVLASARLSERSVRRYRRFAAAFDSELKNLTVAAQTQTDAQRFIAIGASPQRVYVTGNVKFDMEVAPEVGQDGEALRISSFAGRPVWVAGSTHAVEEDIVIEAHRRLLQSYGNALLILAPRHPHRFDQVRGHLSARTLRFASRSRQGPVHDIDILLADTLGELLLLYAAADVAFVGGSLVPIGGHNLLEPAALGKPVLTGPYNTNSQDIAKLMLASGAALQVNNAEELATTLLELFLNPKRREAMGEKGREIMVENRGAVENVMTVIEQVMQ